MTKEQIFEAISIERNRQDELWGLQIHTCSDWMLILGEEYGEVLKEANEYTFTGSKEARTKMKEELIQLLAVGTQILERFYR